MKLFTHIFLLLSLQVTVFAQPGMYTEQDISEQSDFISALSLIFDEEYEQAIEKLDELIEASPNNAVLYAERAESYAKWKKLDKAYADIQKAIRFDKGKLSFYQIKYDIETSFGNYDQLIGTCQKLVELEPENVLNYYDLFNSYRGAGQDKKALETLNQITKLFGVNERVTNSKVTMLSKINDYSGVTHALESLIDAYPYEAVYKHKLVQHLMAIDEEEKAIVVYRDILEIDPDDASALNALKKTMTLQGDSTTKNSSIVSLIENVDVPINTKILELIPYIQNMSSNAEDDQNQKLTLLVEKLKELHPNEAKAYSIAGDFYFNSTQTNLAIQNYKQTIKLKDTVFDVWTQLLMALYFEGNYTDLLKYAEETIDLFPNKLDGYYFAALGEAYTNSPNESTAYAQEAIFIAGKNKYWTQKLATIDAHVKFASGRDKESLSSLLKLEPFFEQDAITAKLYGDGLSKTSQKKKAVEFWKRAVKLGYNTQLLKEQIYAAGS